MMENKPVAVMVDSREPEPYTLFTYGGVRPVVTTLDVGDLWITTSDNALILVERKTASDLISSIADGRLLDQCASMKGMSPWAYLAVQGVIAPTTDGKIMVDGSRREWGWASVQGALQTVQEFGVVVLYVSGDPTEYQQLAARLAGRDRSAAMVRPSRVAEFLPDDLNILMALPGIGLERAKVLGRELPAAWALEYLTDVTWTSDRIPGIGAGTKNRVRQAFGLKEGQRLAVIDIYDVPIAPPACRESNSEPAPPNGATVELASLDGTFEAVSLFNEGN